MESDLKINEAGLDLIKLVEGLRLEAYLDTGKVWTIGYGHTGPNIERGVTCTQAQADQWLREDVAEAEDAVNDHVRYEINDNEFSALVCFVYNVGAGLFVKSTLLKKINAGDLDAVPDQLRRWVLDNGKAIPGLAARREQEIILWEMPVDDEEDAEPLVS